MRRNFRVLVFLSFAIFVSNARLLNLIIYTALSLEFDGETDQSCVHSAANK